MQGLVGHHELPGGLRLWGWPCLHGGKLDLADDEAHRVPAGQETIIPSPPAGTCQHFNGDMLAVFGDITVSLAKGCKLQSALRMRWKLPWGQLSLLHWHRLTAGPRPDP